MLTCNILIVDDDPDDRQILMETFQEIGVKGVHGVASAEAAIAFLQSIVDDKDFPKLIMTDFNMPGINGYELLKALKQMRRYQHIPVMVCSTSKADKDVEVCLTSGAKDYVVKPSAFSEYINLTKRVSTFIAG